MTDRMLHSVQYRSSSLTLCFGFVGGQEPFPPYGSVTPEPHEHPVAVGRQGDVVGPPGTECGEEGGCGVWTTVNLKQSEKLGVGIQPINFVLCRRTHDGK